MMDFRKLAIPTALAIGLTGSAAGAVTHGTTVSGLQTFQTTEIDTDHPSGALEGSLHVTISADGIVQGYFRPADSGAREIDVSGGVDGYVIHLNIGDEVPIEGTYVNGRIVGYRLLGTDRYQFVAEVGSEGT